MAVLEAIELTRQDTLGSILARLQATSADRVLLVVPRKLTLSAPDLLILQREAAASGRRVALLTGNVTLRRRAAAAGINAFRSRWWAQRTHWRALHPRPVRRPESPSPGGIEAPFGHGLYSPHSPTGFRPVAFRRSFKHATSAWWIELGLALALLALAAGMVYILAIIIPSATITVTPVAEPLQVRVPLTAIQDAPVDADTGVVPARILSAQVSGEGKMPTTGRRMEPSAKAKGQVVIINRTGRQVTVPSGTIVATATGNNVRFATLAEAPLAPNARANVPIEATLSGPSGNVRAGTITQVEGPLSLSVVVANDGPTAGGGLSRVGVVTDEDKTALQAQLFEQLKKAAYDRLNEKIGAQSFVPAESVDYLALSPTFTPFVGEVAPELTLNMTVQAVGLNVDTQAAQQIALKRLQDAMPPGTRVISDTIRFVPGSVSVPDEKQVKFDLTATGTLLRGVDRNAVRSAVVGLSPEAARQTLMERFQLARPPEIHLGPDWLPFIVPIELPALPWRIRVNVDWDGAAELARL
jgi:hypothetical protein